MHYIKENKSNILLKVIVISLYPLFLLLLQYNGNSGLFKVDGSFVNHNPPSKPFSHYHKNNNYNQKSKHNQQTIKYRHQSFPILFFQNENHNEYTSRIKRNKIQLGETNKRKNEIQNKKEDPTADKQFIERTKRSIVLIDDEESIRLAVGDFLYDAGYQVTACADADAFLDLYNPNLIKPPAAIPDVIVSDIRMPNSSKDGIDLTKIIRSDDRLSRVPIILLTAKTLTNDRILGYKAGANIYLPKPFDPNELLAIIDNLIYRKNQIVDTTGSATGSKILDLQNDMADIKYILQQQNYNIDSSKSNSIDTAMQDDEIYLTPVELEVLELLSNGYTNGEIANKRNVGIAWVNRIIQNMYGKTGTKTRTELVRWAMKNNQISTR